MMRMTTLLAILAVLAFAAGTAQGAAIYEAELVPELVQPQSGASAYGQATLIINDQRTEAFLTLNFAGLDTPQTGAALIIGAADEVGNVFRQLPLGAPLAEVFNHTAVMQDALDNDSLAVQVYSEAWPGGAIRGNFQFVIVSTSTTTWSQVKTLFD